MFTSWFSNGGGQTLSYGHRIPYNRSYRPIILLDSILFGFLSSCLGCVGKLVLSSVKIYNARRRDKRVRALFYKSTFMGTSTRTLLLLAHTHSFVSYYKYKYRMNTRTFAYKKEMYAYAFASFTSEIWKYSSRRNKTA